MKPCVVATGVVACLLALACGSVRARVVYEDDFDNDGIDVNTVGIGIGGIGGGAGQTNSSPASVSWAFGEWVEDGNLTIQGGSWGGTSANAFSLNAFAVPDGFRLEVSYNAVSASSRFTIGLIEEAGASQRESGALATSGSYAYRGIIHNVYAYDSQNRYPNAPGLQLADGVSVTQLSNAQGNGGSSVVIEMDADSNWSYSVDGQPPTTGTIGGAGFDLTRRYCFFTRSQKASIRNQITSVTLTVPQGAPQAAVLLVR